MKNSPSLPFIALFALSLLQGLFCPTSNAINIDLPFGDINVLVLTDVHSWVGGHGNHNSSMDADYGDVLSFYERLKDVCNEEGRDLWFVMNGDFNDGTGLSTYPPYGLVPILQKMPWDAVTIGNHELYKTETIEYITQPGGMVQWFGERYITSNTVHAQSDEPIGHRYRMLHGEHGTVLTFGFLYNLEIGSPMARVIRVEDTVNSEWFLNALRGGSGDFDAVMILAHMDVQDPLVKVILSTIRNECGGDMPVQFITGHTHIRAYEVMDEHSASFEAGHYLDTVGFVSFPNKQTITQAKHLSTGLFRHEFLNANVKTLESKLGVKDLETESGAALSEFIQETQKSMGLTKVVGCSNSTFRLQESLQQNDSLWRLFLEEVVPTQLIRNDPSKVVLMGSQSAFRCDLFEGNITVDDIISMSPFNDTLYIIAPDIPGYIILQAIKTLNEEKNTFLTMLPRYIPPGLVLPEGVYDLYTVEYEVPFITSALKTIYDAPIQPKQSQFATTSLWFSFIEEYWPCPFSGGDTPVPGVYSSTLYPPSEISEHKHYGVMIFSISFTLVALFIAGFYFHKKKFSHNDDKHISRNSYRSEQNKSYVQVDNATFT